MTYAATEPKHVTGYQDRKGMVHANRDDAISANFDYDLRDSLRTFLGKYSGCAYRFEELLIRYVAQHPDMVRVLLGDRDAT
jgi:hypothetical protein